ncbi:MAG: acetolactate synthase [Planctomycetales bacterium]|nr:acetolactate synthase [Planctomycetales bacterium]
MSTEGGNGNAIDGGAGTVDLRTMRGRNFPTIRQFTVFLENRVGQLLEVVRRFEGSRVRICALSINDSTECAFVRFLVSHPEQGREILERAGLPIVESDLIGVELPEGPQPLLRVCSALLQAEINIVQAYPLFFRPYGRPGVALMVDNIELAQDTLALKGFQMITERDLTDLDESTGL